METQHSHVKQTLTVERLPNGGARIVSSKAIEQWKLDKPEDQGVEWGPEAVKTALAKVGEHKCPPPRVLPSGEHAEPHDCLLCKLRQAFREPKEKRRARRK